MNQGIKDMQRLQELVRLHRKGTRVREVARLLKMSPNTERAFRRKLDAAGLLAGSPEEELPALETLKKAVREGEVTRPKQEMSSIERWRDHVDELRKKGIGPTAIHQVLREKDDSFPGSLSAVKRLVARMARENGPDESDVAIPVVTGPGKVAQVDFGFVGWLWDPVKRKRRKAWVFVMVLGCSRHAFAKVAFDQRIETWLQLHVEAFEWFGGVPEVVVPDNLKAAVIRAAFAADEVAVLNRAYRELARHYDFVIDPTPPYSPEKKGKVESAVKYIKRSFFEPRDFSNLDDANERLASWMMDTAGQRRHGTTGRKPLEVFEDTERAVLQPLPRRWEPVLWAKAKVGRNVHIRFDGKLWSVPWKHLGERVLVRATEASVEIYFEDQRIATHPRKGVLLWSTQDSHLPPERAALRQRDRSYWEEQADEMGSEVGAFIREVFDADKVQQPIRRVSAIMRTLSAVPVERARAACSRAAYFGTHRADGIRRILRDRLDEQPLPGTLMSPTWASSPKFARSAEAFLASTEVAHGTC